MICPKCNWQNTEGTKFCMKCGTALGNLQELSTQANMVNQQPTNTNVGLPTPMPTPMPMPPARKKEFPLAIILIAFLVVTGIIGSVVLKYSEGSTPENATSYRIGDLKVAVPNDMIELTEESEGSTGKVWHLPQEDGKKSCMLMIRYSKNNANISEKDLLEGLRKNDNLNRKISTFGEDEKRTINGTQWLGATFQGTDDENLILFVTNHKGYMYQYYLSNYNDACKKLHEVAFNSMKF